jgi:hypothetical protein
VVFNIAKHDAVTHSNLCNRLENVRPVV